MLLSMALKLSRFIPIVTLFAIFNGLYWLVYFSVEDLDNVGFLPIIALSEIFTLSPIIVSGRIVTLHPMLT